MAVSVLNDLEKLKYFQFSLSQHFGKTNDFFWRKCRCMDLLMEFGESRNGKHTKRGESHAA